MFWMNLVALPALLACLLGAGLMRGECWGAEATPLPRSDANGNPLRRAPTGHVSNYDEGKAGGYTLPDPLAMRDGTPVEWAEDWFNRRRPELIGLYESHIYGRVPATAPKVTFEVAESSGEAMEGRAIRRHVIGTLEGEPEARFNVYLYLPAKAAKPTPVFLHLMFFGGDPVPAADAPPRRFDEAGPVAEILAAGYGYATMRYTEIEGDSRTNNLSGVRRLALKPGQAGPAAEEWGTISAWAWGASRVLDYFQTDALIDATRVGLIGHSRLGKTVLWAGARDPRFALVFSSCSGEMGAALARRDYGETVDDMAANFPWQFAGRFQDYPGRWDAMPVDAHLLIALNAPHPVFITGGTRDQWADPHGQFLAQVAAGPVYRLLGRNDVGVTELPPLDTPLITGHLGFHYHTGGHTITPEDWRAFLKFSDRHLLAKTEGVAQAQADAGTTARREERSLKQVAGDRFKVVTRGRWWADGGRHREELARFDPYKDGLPEEIQQRLAAQYVVLFQLFDEYRDLIERVSFWNLHDGQSWLNYFPWQRTNHPLLFDRNRQTKPAFDAVYEALEASRTGGRAHSRPF